MTQFLFQMRPGECNSGIILYENQEGTMQSDTQWE